MYLEHLKRRKKLLIIDKYAYTNKLNKTNPNFKFGLVILDLMLIIGFGNNYLNLSIFVLMVFLTTVIARIPTGNYLKIFSIPLGFLILSILAILISFAREDVFLFSFKIFNIYIGVTELSIVNSINTISRVMGSLSATLFLALTTPLTDIIGVFKKIHIPTIMIELLVLTYRFIFIFLEEASEIRLSQEIRFGYSNFKNSLNSVSLLIRSLFLRVMLKYQDMIIALDTKLYDGEFKIGD